MSGPTNTKEYSPWPGTVTFSVFMLCITAITVAWIVWG